MKLEEIRENKEDGMYTICFLHVFILNNSILNTLKMFCVYRPVSTRKNNNKHTRQMNLLRPFSLFRIFSLFPCI